MFLLGDNLVIVTKVLSSVTLLLFVTELVAGQQGGQINPDVDAKALARMLVSAIDGMGLHYCMFHMEADSFQRQYRELEAMIRQRLSC